MTCHHPDLAGVPLISFEKRQRFHKSSKGDFHLSELTGQTFPVTMIQPDQLNPKLKAMVFFSKNSRKSLFHFQTDQSGHGPAGQHRKMESAPSPDYWLSQY